MPSILCTVNQSTLFVIISVAQYALSGLLTLITIGMMYVCQGGDHRMRIYT